MRYLLIAIVSLGILALAACRPAASPERAAPTSGIGQRVEAPGGRYTLVSATELQGMLQQKAFVLVNVHVPYEGEIAQTDLFIPYNEIEQHLDELPAKDAKIVLYCRSGSMSRQAARTLVSLGYTDVYDVEGGMVAWADAGLPLEQRPQ